MSDHGPYSDSSASVQSISFTSTLARFDDGTVARSSLIIAYSSYRYDFSGYLRESRIMLSDVEGDLNDGKAPKT